MCGIAGIVVPPGAEAGALRAVLDRMRAAQQHRGPDDAGTYWSADGQVGLAACRLAIRDLSPAGHMPMCVDDVCITYNGEIYNADELRAELQSNGAQFFSHSDTEVILRGYLRWGEEIVPRLRGMFAFGIHDAPRNVVFLARDPLGIKPLYYARGGRFCFASELGALVGSGAAAGTINRTALSAYLQLGSVPAPHTMYADIAALLPGHYARLELEGERRFSTRQYWTWPEVQGLTTARDVAVALEDAVRTHLVSDVPVGAFLSGGLDSSAIVALAAGLSSEPLRTCSIGFQSRRHNEAGYARAVARALDTQHHERIVNRAEFFGSMDGFIRALDQPSIDGFNTYFVAQTAADVGLKVALSGLGGDELFGGYPTFAGVPRVLRMVKSARALAGANARYAIDAVARSDRWRKVAEATRRPSSPASAFMVYRGLFGLGEAEEMMPDVVHFDAVAHVQKRAGLPGRELKSWVGRAELATYTTNQLLRDADAMSMAHSLEVRVPLLDRALVETVFALPPRVRFGGPGHKPLLRRLMLGRLPPFVLDRSRRQGFTFPLDRWLLATNQREMWHWDAPVFDGFDQRALQRVQQRFRAGRAHWSRAWALIALNEWSRRSPHV